MPKYEIKNYGIFSPPCHNGVVEVIPGLQLSGKKDYYPMVDKDPCVDILVPLDSITGDAWDCGWRGEIRYLPIKDFSIAPVDVITEATERLANEVLAGKRVGTFCLGGHGRTGYVASLILGFLGVEDPVGFLRKNYCKKAVETREQLEQIAEILGKPEILLKHKESKPLRLSGYAGYDWRGGYTGSYTGSEVKVIESYKPSKEPYDVLSLYKATCYDCVFLDLKVGNEKTGNCLVTGKWMKSKTKACPKFMELDINY